MVTGDKLIKCIKGVNNDTLSSITFKVLIGQLQTLINYNKNSERTVITKFEEFVKRYGHLESVKADLDKYFK